ncbi:hypothetical protein [Streptomyces sp. NPDC101150]|uniref:hypothetical protein n=1 Tax=Streptomyces sp. NPDC101150 TaxID=3366114 RepID=UPI00382BADC4
MTTQSQEQHPSTTPKPTASAVTRWRPIGPYAREYAQTHGDPARWTAQHEPYLEFGGSQ